MRALLVIPWPNAQLHLGAGIPQKISIGEGRMAAITKGIVVINALCFGDPTKIHLG